MTLTDPPRLADWQDTARTPRARAEALLAEMTLAEKIGQLGSTWPGSEDLEEQVAPLQESHVLAQTFDEAIRDGVGHLTRPFGTRPIDPGEGMERLAHLQDAVRAANRFGIPAIAHEECLTGLTAWQATVYPTPLAWAATFDPDLVSRMGAAIGDDMRALGVHQGLAPVLDVVRDYRWGRVEETMGEDPYLVAEIAAGYVEGLQSAGIVATLKHFVGYSASRGARNHAPVSVGPRELRDVLLPPFERAVVGSGVRSVMNSYTDLDGVPTASDAELLTSVLREEWGFDGTVVSDYWAIAFLQSMHRIVTTPSAAGRLALAAGIDVELPHTLAYTDALAAEEGGVELIDRAVLRVLTQKAELGLLDADWRPREPRNVDLDSPRNRELARDVAERSVTLLKNSAQTLPLTAPPARIAVVGPAADDLQCLFGCYSFPNHVMPNFPDLPLGVTAPTIRESISAEFPESEIVFERGVDIVAPGTDGIRRAVLASAEADLTVVVVGDRSGMFGHGTSGEGCDALDLDLPGEQSRLVEAVLDVARRVVFVVVSGRPYAVGGYVERAEAALQAFLPGQEGASAIAGILSGRVSPSGRLPVQIPGASSAQPGTYLAPPLALRSEGISNIDPTPAFPFGFGLGFTTFAIDEAEVSDPTVQTDGSVRVTATVRNTGTVSGTAVPQLYLSDPEAEIARPVRQLVAFARVDLDAGASARVSFDVHADIASYTGRDLRRRVEAGVLTFTVASDAGDPGTAASVELVGPTRFIGAGRALRVPTHVESV